MAERDVIINLVVKGGDTSSQQLEKVAQSEQDVAVSAGQATKALDAQTKELNENATAAANVSKQNQSLRGQLRAIQQELAKLALAGKANTAEYKRLRDEAGNLQDAIADAAAEIRQAGSDTRGLDKAIRVATTATAAFGLVQGAAALFGDENEELQKSLLKVNAALTVLTSLQQIQEELSRKDSVFTAAAAKAKLLYAAAVGASTGALRIFRLALIATGIGAIVVLVGLLIANWDRLTAAFDRSAVRLKNLNKAYDENKKATDAAIKSRELEIQLLEAAGTAEDVLANKKKQNAKLTVGELRNELLELQALRQEEINRARVEVFLFNGKEKRAEKIKKIEDEYAEKIQAVNDKINQQRVNFVSAESAINKYNEEQQKLINEAAKAAEELDLLNKKVAALNLNFVKATETKAAAGSIQDLSNQIANLRSELELISPDDISFNFIANAIGTLEQRLESLRKSAERTGTSLVINFDKIAEALKKSREDRTDDEEFLDSYKKEQDFIKQIPFLRAESLKQEIAIRKKAGEDVTSFEQQLQDTNIQLAQTAGQKALEFYQSIQNARLAILQNQLKQGLISEEEYNKKVAELNRKQAIADKLKALFDIALNTAVGITAALRAVPPNPVLAALYGVLGGIQAGVVAATPIPKFRKGGDVDILKGGRERLGQLFGNSHEQGGILIEAEGGEHITRKSMAKKYRPLLHAINSDTVDTFLKPNTLAMPMPKRLSNSEIKSSRQAEKRMAELIEEVRFLSQYVRQGNKYAKVTADTNTQMVNKKTTKVYV